MRSSYISDAVLTRSNILCAVFFGLGNILWCVSFCIMNTVYIPTHECVQLLAIVLLESQYRTAHTYMDMQHVCVCAYFTIEALGSTS